jgi:hypothetical protein
MTDDEKVARRVSQKYGELGAEEPPRALDEAILAASRHAVRPWSRRWAVPFSIAAVLVLSVTVTLRMQHEQPGIESPVPQAKESAPQAKEPVPVAASAAPAAAAEAQPRPKAAVQKQRPVVRKEPEPFQAAPQDLAAAPLEIPSRRDAMRSAESSAAGVVAGNAAAPAMAQMRASAAKAAPADTPERELERIAGLRARGMHDEADKALAEFRKRYPDYKMSAAMLKRVERR